MKKQGILLHFGTCIVKGVSFFLFIVLSSMVSGTEKLIILLEKKNTLVATHAHNTDRAFITTLKKSIKEEENYKVNTASLRLLHIH